MSRRHELSERYIPIAVAASLILACPCAAASPQTETRVQARGSHGAVDRAAIAAKIRARKTEVASYHAREKGLERRQEAGEPVGAELAAMKRDRPGFSDLKDDALKVIEGDPSDEAAFLSISVALGTSQPTPQSAANWPTSSDSLLHQRLAALLLKYHLQRPDFMEVAGSVAFPSREAEEAFWTRVYEGSADHAVRGNALWCRLRLRRQALDDFGLSLARKQKLRVEIRRDGGLLTGSYQDVPNLSALAKDLISGLQRAPGSLVPDFAVSTLLDGRLDSLGKHRGHYVLLDFWATWCTWCVGSHRDLAVFTKELGSKQFEVLSANVDQKKQDALDYVKAHGFPWLDWYLGPDSPVLTALGVQGYPTYILVDPKGVLVGRTNSLTDERKNYIRALLKPAAS